MITQTINGNEILLVTVPEDAIEFRIPYLNEIKYKTHKSDWQTLEIFLEYWKYAIIGKASDLTEQQWQGIVECHPNFDTSFQDYNRILGPNAFYSCSTASESGLSLLASHNLDPKTTLVIVKK